MGGMFYGSREELLNILNDHFGSLIPLKNCDTVCEPIMEDKKDKTQCCFFASINEKVTPISKEKQVNERGVKAKKDKHTQEISLTQAQQSVIDFINGIDPITAYATNEPKVYDVLPNAPASTCDQPHPHKVTSAFSKNASGDDALVDLIFEELTKVEYKADVRRYMVWHCLGGAMKSEKLEKESAFAYRNKPYLLQLQAWWNHAGQLRNDEARDEDYVKWVNEFRQKLSDQKLLEGAFINFVDKDIVSDISKKAHLLRLLELYYGENLSALRQVKKAVDPNNLFKFEMSIPPIS